eukprot:806253-Alexandrium_andersonii.AAC.1
MLFGGTCSQLRQPGGGPGGGFGTGLLGLPGLSEAACFSRHGGISAFSGAAGALAVGGEGGGGGGGGGG